MFPSNRDQGTRGDIHPLGSPSPCPSLPSPYLEAEPVLCHGWKRAIVVPIRRKAHLVRHLSWSSTSSSILSCSSAQVSKGSSARGWMAGRSVPREGFRPWLDSVIRISCLQPRHATQGISLTFLPSLILFPNCPTAIQAGSAPKSDRPPFR